MEMNLEKVYARSKSQSLEVLTYMALESLMKSDLQIAIPDETQVLPKWRAAKNKAVAKNLKMDAEREQLFAFLEEQGIWYVALKGVVLCHLYPNTGCGRWRIMTSCSMLRSGRRSMTGLWNRDTT